MVIKKTINICGVDEAGRGPLAGPVVAAAVILRRGFPRSILNDSKKLSPAKREEIIKIIIARAIYSVGWVWPEEIDKLNIHNATLLAMKRAITSLPSLPEVVLIDGKYTPPLNQDIRVQAIVRGDSYIPEIQAASIVAKVIRDLWMERYARIEPLYLFEKHKGYPTPEHRELIKRYGFSPIHRKSFNFTFLE